MKLSRLNAPTSNFYKLFALLLSYFYANYLAYYVPMEGILDRVSYLEYIINAPVLYEWNISGGIKKIIFNETLWLYINKELGEYYNPEESVRILIFVMSIITAYKVLTVSQKHFFFLLFILFVPQVLQNLVVHLRQGLGIALFLLGWFSNSIRVRLFFLILAAGIHTSFFLIILFIFINNILLKLNISFNLRVAITIAIGLIVGLGFQVLSHLIGARQADIYTGPSGGTGLAFIFWSVILGLYLFEGRRFARMHSLEIMFITFYVSTYFLTQVSARVFEGMLIPILVASLNLTSWRRIVFLMAIYFYVGYIWHVKMSLPLLGYGAIK